MKPHPLPGRLRVLLRSIRRLWREPALRLPSAPEVLRLPLRPSARLRLACRLGSFALLASALEWWFTGHPVAAPLLLLPAALLWLPCRETLAPAGPVSLVVAADGNWRLGFRDGRQEAVKLRPESLFLGSHLLLVLRGRRHTFRLLLGPDNLTAAQLSSLRRRLPAGRASA